MKDSLHQIGIAGATILLIHILQFYCLPYICGEDVLYTSGVLGPDEWKWIGYGVCLVVSIIPIIRWVPKLRYWVLVFIPNLYLIWESSRESVYHLRSQTHYFGTFGAMGDMGNVFSFAFNMLLIQVMIRCIYSISKRF